MNVAEASDVDHRFRARLALDDCGRSPVGLASVETSGRMAALVAVRARGRRARRGRCRWPRSALSLSLGQPLAVFDSTPDHGDRYRGPNIVRAQAEGDLRGVGTWKLDDTAGQTNVEYTWSVNLDRSWMRRAVAGPATGVCVESQRRMAAGEAGLRNYLARTANSTSRA